MKDATLSFCQKLRLLLWKNACSICNNRLYLTLSLTMPMILMLCIAILRASTEVRKPGVEEYAPYNLNQEVETLLRLLKKLQARQDFLKTVNPKFKHSVYAPQLVIAFQSNTTGVFQRFSHFLEQKLRNKVTAVSYENCENLRKEMVENHYFAGICIKSDLPKFEYDLVFPSEFRSLTTNILSVGWESTADCQNEFSNFVDHKVMPYISMEGVTALGIIVSDFFIKEKAPNLDISEFLDIGRLPLESYLKDQISARGDFLKYSIVTVLIFPTVLIFHFIVCEKQTAVRTYMKMKGFKSYIQNLAWALTLFVLTLMVSLILVLTLKIKWNTQDAVFTQTDIFLIYFYFVFYCLANAMFCVMVAGLCTSTSYAIQIFIFCWLLTLFLDISNISTNPVYSTSDFLKSLCSYNYNLVKFLVLIEDKEAFVTGYQWYHFGKEEWTYELIISLVISSAMYYLLGLILDDINPGLYGVKFRIWKLMAHKCFVRKQTYVKSDWFNAVQYVSLNTSSSNIFGRSTDVLSLRNIFKSNSERNIPVLVVWELSKTYKQKKILNKLNFTVAPNSIAVVLGGNSCGKSLLCRILGGLDVPTSGGVMINDHYLFPNMSDALRDVGLAIGNLLLFENLTVAQQVIFNVKANGIFGEFLKKNNHWQLCEGMDLMKYKNRLTKKLSLSEQNQLAVVCACCIAGNFVILDGIETHLDSAKETHLIKFLQSWRSNAAIFLATNSCSFAQKLADQIILINNSEIVCDGSLDNLRAAIGESYSLTLTKSKHFKVEHMEKLKALIMKYFDDIHMKNPYDKTYITYVLPLNEEEKIIYLLEDIERAMKLLSLKNIEFRQSGFHNFFWDINTHEVQEVDSKENVNQLLEHYIKGKDDPYKFLSEYKVLTGWRNFLQRIVAMIRTNYWINSSIIVLISYYFLSPILLCCFVNFLLSDSAHAVQNVPRLMYPTSCGNVALIVSVRHADKKHRANLLMANTFWFYRETSYEHNFKIIDTHGIEVSDFIHHQVQVEKKYHTNVVYLGGIEKHFKLNGSVSNVALTSYYSHQRDYSQFANFNLLLESFMKASFGSENTIRATLDPLPYERNVNRFQFAVMNKGIFTLSLCIVFLMQFPFFKFYDNELFKEKTTEMSCHSRGYEYWLSTFICLLPQVVALDIIIVILGYFQYEYSMFLESLVAICVATTVCCIYCRYYRLLIDYCLRDPYVANCLTLLLFLFGFLDYLNDDPNPLLPILPHLWRFLIPLILVEDLLQLIVVTINVNLICSYEDVSDIAIHINQCNSVPKCCETDTPWVLVQRYLVYFVVVTIFICVLVGVIANFFYIKDQVDFFKKPSKHGTTQVSTASFESSESLQKSLEHFMHFRKKAVILESISKQYKRVELFSDECLRINRGDIFSIVGANNVGKTVLLKMLARKVSPSEGLITVLGESCPYIARESASVEYSPQDIDLPYRCDVGQYIENYARKVGIAANDARTLCTDLAKKLNIYSEYRSDIRQCSTGTKRMIVFLMAFIGNPKLLLLDAPLVGVDCTCHRNMSNLLRVYTKQGGTVIFTSATSVDYNDFTDNLVFLNSGCFKFVGTVHDLNKLHSSSYLLNVKLKVELYQKHKIWNKKKYNYKAYVRYAAFIERYFEGVRERLENFPFIFHLIPSGKTSLARIFRLLSENSANLSIDEFTISTDATVLLFEEFGINRPYKSVGY